MCSHYQALKKREHYMRHFGVQPPPAPGKLDLWPGYLGSFIRRHPLGEVGDEAVPPREALSGLFGLVPHWSLDTKITKHTFNARSETVASKPSFREAWKRGQHCIIPADAFFDPDWRSGTRQYPPASHALTASRWDCRTVVVLEVTQRRGAEIGR